MKSELIEIVRKLREHEFLMRKYLDSIPTDIRTSVFDNEYVNQLSMQRDLLIDNAFGDYVEDIFWFLYEFEPGKNSGPHITLQDGTEYTFYTDEDYYHYLESQ